MRALDDMVRAGKVLYVGISDTPAWIVSQATTLAELRGWSRFVGLQVQYSLVQRTVERELLPMARALDIGVTAWGALGSGLLSGKYTAQPQSTEAGRLDKWGADISDKERTIAETVQKVADEIGAAPAQVALNWVRQQPGIVIPILGARKTSQIENNLGCLDFQLSDEHLQTLEEVSKIELGFPHDFLAQDGIKDTVYGGTFSLIDNHHS